MRSTSEVLAHQLECFAARARAFIPAKKTGYPLT